MDIGGEVSVDGFDCGAAQEPITEGDAVAAEIHECAATGFVHIPEPGAVWTEVFFALLDEIDFAESALVGHLLGLDVFGSEEEFFGIGEEDTLASAGVDHFVRFGEGSCRAVFRRRRVFQRWRYRWSFAREVSWAR